MALAQDTTIFFLDEPTTFLDMAHQLEVLKLLESLNREEGRTIVMVVHAQSCSSIRASYRCDHEGAVVCEGEPQHVITKTMLRNVFDIEADIVTDPRSGQPLCLPFGLASEPVLARCRPFTSERSILISF